jgi:hypothetical protein
MWLKTDYNDKDMKLNLNLNLGDGYLYGDATTESSSYKINITQGWPDTALIMPTGLNQNPGQKSISFHTESGNRFFLRGDLKNEDTDMIRLFTNMDTLNTVNRESANIYGYTRFRRRSERIMIFKMSYTFISRERH